MPLYEYSCPDCSQTFDKIIRFSEADKTPVCPHCGEQNAQKLISAGAVIGVSSSGTSTTSRPPSNPFT